MPILNLADPTNVVSSPLSRASELFSAGRLGAAKELLDGHLSSCPQDLDARFLRAGVLVRTGEWDRAADDLDAVLGQRPDDYECLVLMGLVRKNQFRFDESVRILHRAIQLAPADPSAYNTLGMCFLSMRRIDAAVQTFEQAIARNPRSGATYQNLGLALRLAEKRHRALEAFQKAVEFAPDNPTNFISLSEQQRRMGLRDDAIRCLEQGRKHHPRCLPIMLALASTYGDRHEDHKAAELFESCTRIDPRAVQEYALWLQDQGRFEDAIEKLLESIELHPQQGQGYLALAEAKRFELKDGSPLSERAASLLAGPSVPKVSRMYLWYALAKAREQENNYQEAMGALDQANGLAFSIYNEGRPFDFSLGRMVTDRSISLYSEEAFRRVHPRSSPSDVPILIVGMVRSGTTLLDQIVSSHPVVRSAGETVFWMEESDRLYACWRDAIDPNDLDDLANRYLRHLAEESGDAPRITDKMPLNFLHIGHIHATFPNAKIIHIRRNPIDTCLSIYATHFGGGPHFAYKKEHIVFYYQQYLRLMEHWRRVIPEDRLLELDYEELVNDRRRVVEEVLGFCGLPWAEACMHHEDNAAAITTPSRWQARQPVYSTSVEKWRRFEPWLGAFEQLKSAAHPPVRPVPPRKDDAVTQSLTYGTWFQERGRFDEAEAQFRTAIDLNPRSGRAYLELAEASRISLDEHGFLDRTKAILRDPTTSAWDRVFISFALGKALDQGGSYEEAAQCFSEANDSAFKLHGEGARFDSDVVKNYPDKIARIYSAEALERHRSMGSDSDAPILIVGMIRSGTTLLDQIVSSHSQVAAAGELPYWRIAGDRFNRTWYKSGIDAPELGGLRTPYLELLAAAPGEAQRVTDKMPLNFELLGMIHLAFPKAKILHIRRNPADTCLSLFQNYYGGSATFAYNWDNIATYYRAYMRFMELWRGILPQESMLELDYEALVSKPEPVVRDTIEFLGLPWEGACLRPRDREGTVATPSKWQVRQPIHTGSVGKWRRYSPCFPQLLALAELRHPPVTIR